MVENDDLFRVYDKVVAKKITEVIKYRKITVKELANRLGRSSGTISNWKQGNNPPSARDVVLISRLTRMNMKYFFDADITPEEADLLISNVDKTNVLSSLKNRLFPDGYNFSQERLDLAAEAMILPSETIPVFLSLIKDFEEEILLSPTIKEQV